MSIRPTFSGIYTARSGITASQYNLDITGQNLTNAQTPGYTRQRTDVMSVGDNGYKSKYADANSVYIGQGVQVIGTSQLRNPGYDIRYRQQNTEFGYYETQLSGLEDLERIFDEIMQGSGLHSLFTDSDKGLQEALQNLSTDPNSAEALQSVKSLFSQVVDMLRKNGQAVDSVNDQQLDDFKLTTDKVNNLLTKIADLNKLIDSDARYGNPAHELKDQRNLMLDELSGYLDMDYSYDKDGKLNINLKTDSGEKLPLVQGDKAVKLSLHTESHDGLEKLHIRVEAADGMKDQDGNPLTDKVVDGNDVTGGSLGAYFNIINADGAFGTDSQERGISYYDKMLDTFANNFAQTVNNLNRGRLDIDKDGGLIIPSSGYGAGNEGTAITSENTKLLYDGEGNTVLKRDADGNTIPLLDVDGNPVLDEDGNPVPTPMSVDDFNNLADADKEALVKDGLYLNDSSYNLLGSKDGGDITANNIDLTQGWRDNDRLFQVALDQDKLSPDATAANNNILRYLTVMQSSSISFECDGKNMFTGSWAMYFSNLQTTLGGDVSTTELLSKSYSVNVDALDNRRMSVSGVDENEETANMLIYEKAFQASSRLMTTIDEMLDKLINGTGMVGR